ncbi:MAG: hypothetical protein HY558_03850, partial [Euryarchaeota archaeon]|nr:hypothetical protein [Euryarchaeota archaeon]
MDIYPQKIEGRRAVLEALRGGHPLNKIWVARGLVPGE